MALRRETCDIAGKVVFKMLWFINLCLSSDPETIRDIIVISILQCKIYIHEAFQLLLRIFRPGIGNCHSAVHRLRETFADSEDTDLRRSHSGVFYIDVNSIPLFIVETFSINQRLCGMI
jgi:hypothetical protein